MAGAAVLLFSFVGSVAGSVSRFTTDQAADLDLSAHAERTVYREEGQSSFAPSVSCRVTELATGEDVPTSPMEGFSREHSDKALVSMVRFRADRSGRYRVSCSTTRSRPVRLAVGRQLPLTRSIARIFEAAATALVGLCAAVAIAAVTAVKRHERRSGRS